MKIPMLVVASSILAATGAISSAVAQASGEQRMYTPQEIKWSAAPPSLPIGAEVAVLYGDPSKEALFAMRIKVPKGYRIAPHSHPKPEVTTVLSGTARLGMGESADATKAHVFPAGSFWVNPPGMVHYFSADEDTVVQVNSIGPWGITYVNAEDDPRRKTQ
jgi:quercetin dioxygenase-like cupin family protein